MPEIPELDDFRIALSDRRARARMGLQLADGDAALLIADDDWAVTYYRQWLGEHVRSDPAAPVALPRSVALAPALPVPVVLDAPIGPAPERRRIGHPIRAGIVAAMVGSVAAVTLVLIGIPHATADATGTPGGAPQTVSDPFPAGLDADATAAPSTEPVADPVDRLSEDVSSALELDARTVAAPAVSGIIRKEVVRIADVACLSGYDDATATGIANAVAGRSDLDRAAGDAVADAIARYCAATG